MGTRVIAHLTGTLIARIALQAQYERQPIYDFQTSKHEKLWVRLKQRHLLS